MKRTNPNQFIEEHPVGGCFTVIVVVLLAIFFGPWVVMHAWSLIAVGMFGAPAMSYWTAFWGTWAVHILTQQLRGKSND